MKRVRAMVRYAVLFFCSTPVWADKPTAPDTVPGASRVDAEQVIELIQTQPDLVLIDTRRSEEFAKGHIDGAKNLLDVEMTRQGLATLAPSTEQPVLFYCNGARCLRSSNACAKAVEWGYKQVYWFRDGWKSWTEKQYPVAY